MAGEPERIRSGPGVRAATIRGSPPPRPSWTTPRRAEPGDTLAQATAGAGATGLRASRRPRGPLRARRFRASNCRASNCRANRDRARRRSRCPPRRFCVAAVGRRMAGRGHRLDAARGGGGASRRRDRRRRPAHGTDPCPHRGPESPRVARTGDPAGRPQAERPPASTGTVAAAEANGAEAGVAEAGASPAAVAAGAPGEVTGSGQDGRTAADDGADRTASSGPMAGAGTGGAGAGGNVAAARPDPTDRPTGEAWPALGGESRGTGTAIAAGTARGGTTQAKPGKKASPWQRKEAAPRQGNKGQDDKAGPGRGETARVRPGRRVTIVAVVALVLVAGTLAVVGIARSGGGPASSEFTLVTPYPPRRGGGHGTGRPDGRGHPAACVADRDSSGGQDRRRHRRRAQPAGPGATDPVLR